MKENTFKDKLIQTAMDYIQENESYIHTNLREIARRAGCAHTNAYNYFSSYNELIWSCFDKILDYLVEFTKNRISSFKTLDELFFHEWLLAQIDFALEHKGFYRLIWIDPFFDNIPPGGECKILALKQTFEALIYKLGNGKFSEAGAKEAADILHGYLHGEICKMISGRLMYEDIPNSKEIIIQNVVMIYKMLLMDKSIA